MAKNIYDYSLISLPNLQANEEDCKKAKTEEETPYTGIRPGIYSPAPLQS